jgi:hypothetical protein
MIARIKATTSKIYIRPPSIWVTNPTSHKITRIIIIIQNQLGIPPPFYLLLIAAIYRRAEPPPLIFLVIDHRYRYFSLGDIKIQRRRNNILRKDVISFFTGPSLFRKFCRASQLLN